MAQERKPDKQIGVDGKHPMLVVCLQGKFSSGQIVITRRADSVLPPHDVLQCLLRHFNGDWGEVDELSRRINEDAVHRGGRVLSRYKSSDGTRFWIFTDMDHSETLVLLPED